jgi:plasmid stabilization system protein ParE
MKTYNIDITPEAIEDLDEIVEHLGTLSEQAALRHYDLIVEKIGTLSNSPERCALSRDVQLRLRGYRLLLVKNYIVFFVIIGDIVEIRRILHSKRNYSEILLSQ